MQTSGDPLEAQIRAWRAYVDRQRELSPADGDELEDHLRDRVADLEATGLDPDEAFLVAVKRIGSLDSLTREFAREHSDRLWKQLVLTGGPEQAKPGAARRDLAVMVLFALAAALLVKLPAAFGLTLEDDAGFYARNLSLFALVPLAGYFAWRRSLGTSRIAALVALFALGAVAANAYPLAEDSAATLLTALHLPLALWLVVGVAYTAGEWRSDPGRMDFIRFTGEWVVYYTLIALGGGVLTGLTAGTFDAIGIDVSVFVGEWLLPCGAVAAMVVAAWLVEAKKSVVENMAPVLTQVFTPLFVIALVALVIGILWVGGIDVDRDVLILFNLLLVVVLGLLVYGISAREPAADPGLFDRLQLALVVTTLAIDVVVLLALAGRITEYGFSANKTAALGENLILLANLAGSAWLLDRLVRGRRTAEALQRWQTSYLTVYAAWAWTVVLVFPLVFGFS